MAMDSHIRGIDHVLIGVHDLEAAAQRWRDLGFVVTPRGRHIGWSTANVCAMLEASYVELIGMVDASAVRHDIAAFLARGEGGMGLALATDDAAGTAAFWRARGITVHGPQPLARRLEDAEGPVELRFANVVPEIAELGGFVVFACFHLTPELVRRSEWLRHPNGATRLRSCTLLADPPEPATRALTALFGEAAAVNTDHVTAFHAGGQTVVVAPLEDVRLFHPQLGEPEASAAPRLVAVEMEVEDPTRTRRWLEAREIPFEALPDRLAVDPARAFGLALEFLAPGATRSWQRRP
ncbi:hypothetical protein HRbin40_00499 [bacterium HR40]|nr:hypothetical protein HRbin40_00499 [bacterium HR40]